MTATLRSAPTDLARRVRRLLDDADEGLAGRRVLALCSGGADSVALVVLLRSLPRGAAPRDLQVLWLDHGLRRDASADLAAASASAEHAGATLHVRRASERDLSAAGGTEAAARAWRYQTALELARDIGCDTICTGHTASDQLEHALLALVGVTGTAGTVDVMPVGRALAPDVRLVRPLLGLTRAQVEAACGEIGIEWAIDPTNLDPDAHVRNAIRQRVVPPLLDAHPGAGQALVRAGTRAREERSVPAALAGALLESWGSGRVLDVRRLGALDTPVRHAIVAEWLRRGGIGRALDARLVRAVDRLAMLPARAACSRVDLPRNACVRRDGYDLTIQPAPCHGGSQP